MPNQFLTDSVIVKESLMELKNQMVFTKSVNTSYDEKFAVEGAKIGDVVNLRLPNRYVANDGPVIQLQDTNEESIPLTLNHHKHVAMGFSQRDLTLSIDRFKERYIKPAVTTLGNSVDSIGYNEMYKAVFSSVGNPSASVFPSTLLGFVNAKAKIASLGGQLDELTATVSELTEASLVEGLKGLFQSSEQIAQQYEKGVMGIAAGSKFKMTQNVAKHLSGTFSGTPLMNGATAEGALSIVTDGWTAASTLNVGDVVSVAGVFAVNPQTYQSTGQLAQFTVQALATADGGGNMTITLDRALKAAVGAKQNVTALPADGAAITIFGHASAYSNIIAPQNMVFHKDAFALACADIVLPKGMDMAARASDPDTGLSIALIRGFDIVNYRTLSRLDIIFGWKCIRPEYACRVVGQPS